MFPRTAIAVGLVERGHPVHLTTTDPAAHLSFVVDGTMPGLTVDRIDPEAEPAKVDALRKRLALLGSISGALAFIALFAGVAYRTGL